MVAAAVAVPEAAAVRVISVHVAVPLSGGDLAGWRADLRALPAATARGPVQVLAGDFNSTLDHDELRGLVGHGYATQPRSRARASCPLASEAVARPPAETGVTARRR